MIREVSLIIDYGYDILTADVIKILKVHLKDDSHEKINTLGIDFSHWSIREKNLLSEFIKNIQDVSFIDFVKQSFQSVNPDVENETRVALLKELNSYQKYFKIYPYNQEEKLSLMVYKMIINNHFKLDIEKPIDLLKEAFRQFSDIKTVKELINDIQDSTSHNMAQLNVEQGNLIRKSHDTKDNIVKLVALGVSIQTANTLAFPLLVMASNHIQNATFATKSLGVVGLMGSAFMSYYSIKRVIQNALTAEDNKRIKYQKSDEIDNINKSKGLIGFELCHNFIYQRNYDKKENYKDLLLFCYLNEKINQIANFPKKMIDIPKDLENLCTPKEKEILLKLDFHKIHQVSHVKDFELKKFLLFYQDEMSFEEYTLVKIMDQNLFITYNKNIDLKHSVSSIKGISKEVVDFLEDEKQPLIQKEILKTYIFSMSKEDSKLLNNDFFLNPLNMLVEEKNFFIPPSAIENLIKNNQLNYEKIQKELLRDYQIELKNFLKRKERTILHRILDGNFIEDTKEKIKKDELKTINQNIIEDIKNVSIQYRYKETLNTIRRAPSFIKNMLPSLKTKTINAIDLAVNQVEHFNARKKP